MRKPRFYHNVVSYYINIPGPLKSRLHTCGLLHGGGKGRQLSEGGQLSGMMECFHM